jgi:Ca2+:H+ antiporter
MKRHVKTEEELDPEIGPIEEAGGPSADILEEKTAEPDEMPQPPPRPTAPIATPINVAATSQAGSKAKMPLGPRGLSFRTPPVFRSSTNPPGKSGDDAAQNNLRRYRSDPNNRQHAMQHNRSPASHRMEGRQTSRSTGTQEADEPPMSQTASIMWLIASTSLVALCAEFLVGSIEHLVDNSPLSEAFVGLIILPIVGNAAEHVTAVTVAAKNKLDLALGVALGSSIQIALFVTPIVVILGWILGKDMSLYFSLFETGSLFVATFIVNFLVLDGRSNYLEGALLCACYVIVA